MKSPRVLAQPPYKQGRKFSDNYLISDFFPTPRTIPEISVNLQRIFLGEEGGVGPLLKVHLVGDMGLQIFKVLKILVYVSHL